MAKSPAKKSKKQNRALTLVYKTQEGVEIFVEKGSKKQSLYDFKVLFKQPNGRIRTPKHIHLIVEMYVKYAHNPELTLKLRDRILEVFDKIKPINYYPPKLQVFKLQDAEQFKDLDSVGEFSVEFLLAATELILIQEKTNYPQGSLTKSLYSGFGVKDRFSVINKATHTAYG